MKPEHKILHQKFQKYGANAREWMRKCVLLLPEIEKYRIWKQKGFGSIYEYAAKLAGMSRNTVDDALRIMRRITDKPALQKVIEEKGINAVRPVASIATSETEKFWAEKAKAMSKHTLETYVREIQKQKNSRTGTENIAEKSHQEAISFLDDAREEESKKLVVMELEPEIIQELEKLKGQGGWNELMKQLLQERKERLETAKPKAVETESRHIPMKIQKYVLAKTNGQCSFPGCTKAYEILHHTQRFALEKIHDPDRLEPLCKEHERLAHHGLIEDEDRPSIFWNLRKNPNENLPKYTIDKIVQKKRLARR